MAAGTVLTAVVSVLIALESLNTYYWPNSAPIVQLNPTVHLLNVAFVNVKIMELQSSSLTV